MSGMSIILKKELKRVFGDKKLVFSMFILPAILMVVIYGLMGYLMGAMNKDVEQHNNKIYVVNMNEQLRAAIDSSTLKATSTIIEKSQKNYEAEKETMKNEILEGESQLIVYLEEGFEDKYKAGSVPKITISYNTTENYSSNAYALFTTQVLGTYETKLLDERLGGEGKSVVFAAEPEIIEKKEKANARFISTMLPYMMIIMLFAGAMSVGVDAMAGEKERGTLASMLISPIKRTSIAAGKIIALMILSGLSAIVYVVSMMLAVPVMNALGASSSELSEGLGNLSLSITDGLELIATMLVLVYLFVAIISFLAIRAKDAKSAQTLISPVYILVMVAGMVTMFMSGNKVPLSRYFIPVYGNAVAVKDLCNKELEIGNFFASLSGTLLIAIVLTYLIAKAFDDEKVMFNA